MNAYLPRGDENRAPLALVDVHRAAHRPAEHRAIRELLEPQRAEMIAPEIASRDEPRAGVAAGFELTGRRRSRRALEGGNPARARPRRARSRWRTSTRSLRGRETPPEPKQAAPTLAPALRALASRCLRRQSTPTQRPASSGWPRSVPGSSSAGCRTQTSCAVQVVPWPRQSACSAR